MTNNDKYDLLLKSTKISDKEKQPIIFTEKKSIAKSIRINNLMQNQEGEIRHFLPANKEWFNSVYAYNSNYVKNLPSIDKGLNKLISNYFNFYFKSESLKSRPLKYTRRSSERIFVSKGELKHTNDKVIITLYVYNEEKRVLMARLRKFFKAMYSKKSLLSDKTLLRRFSLLMSLYSKRENLLKNVIFKYSYVTIPAIKSLLIKTAIKTELLVDNYKSIISFFNLVTFRFKNSSIFFYILNKTLGEELKNKVLRRLIILKQSLDYLRPWTFNSEHARYVIFAKEFEYLSKYWSLLYVNNIKFENKFISKLSNLVSKLYNKKIEFNVVNLKYLYLNSDIFSQFIALKLKEKKNRVLYVLKTSLSLVKLPKVNRVVDKYGTGNKQNINLYKAMPEFNYNKDIFNQLLLDNFSYEKKINNFGFSSLLDNKSLEANIVFSNKEKNANQIKDIVFNSLRYKSMAGVRLEAKGRLTKRSTASRSLFKVKWKGSLRNIDSSYKGLSSVLLRGHFRSNLQYSLVNSKSSNGAFGLKGWVSGK